MLNCGFLKSFQLADSTKWVGTTPGGLTTVTPLKKGRKNTGATITPPPNNYITYWLQRELTRESVLSGTKLTHKATEILVVAGLFL